MARTLLSEIECKVKHHQVWEGRDFAWAQIFVWAGLIASTASSLYAGKVFDVDPRFAAVVAAVPGLVIVVDKIFKFLIRSQWHARFRIELDGLRRELLDQHAPEKDVSTKLTELERKM